jgi:hypothetical protein
VTQATAAKTTIMRMTRCFPQSAASLGRRNLVAQVSDGSSTDLPAALEVASATFAVLAVRGVLA